MVCTTSLPRHRTVVFFFAAREGILGKKLKQITVTMVQLSNDLEMNLPSPKKNNAPSIPPKVSRILVELLHGRDCGKNATVNYRRYQRRIEAGLIRQRSG